MARARDNRLARLAARSNREKSAEERHRAALRARVALGAALRRSLPQFGVDPRTVTMLRGCDEAAAELAAPRAHRPGSLDAGGENNGRAALRETMARLAQRYRDDPRIDFARASLVQVLAWCMARAGELASRESGNDGGADFAADLLQKQREDGDGAGTGCHSYQDNFGP